MGQRSAGDKRWFPHADLTKEGEVLLHEHFRWTGDSALLRDLRDSFHAALRWILRAFEDGHGYVIHFGTSYDGLRNQRWKDSGESVIRRDGSLHRPPIAPCALVGHSGSRTGYSDVPQADPARYVERLVHKDALQPLPEVQSDSLPSRQRLAVRQFPHPCRHAPVPGRRGRLLSIRFELAGLGPRESIAPTSKACFRGRSYLGVTIWPHRTNICEG